MQTKPLSPADRHHFAFSQVPGSGCACIFTHTCLRGWSCALQGLVITLGAQNQETLVPRACKTWTGCRPRSLWLGAPAPGQGWWWRANLAVAEAPRCPPLQWLGDSSVHRLGWFTTPASLSLSSGADRWGHATLTSLSPGAGLKWWWFLEASACNHFWVACPVLLLLVLLLNSNGGYLTSVGECSRIFAISTNSKKRKNSAFLSALP